MSDRKGRRVRSILRLAQRDEEAAQRAHADGEASVVEAEARRQAAAERVDDAESTSTTSVTPAELIAARQRASLRAADERVADERLRELLEDQLVLRTELLGALRRRRSLENLEERHQATQASIAAHAAQKALDEIASLRRQRNNRR
jgi:hypothetical protein